MMDRIARMMAMDAAQQGGDAYTKSETDALLDGKASLVDGKVPASELPSYVDDTIEGYYYNGDFYEDSEHTTAITREVGKIYIDLTANKSYRWTGSVYVRIDECPAFGEIHGTIYEGNKGKANADAIAAMKDGHDIDSFGDVETALSGKANTSDLGAAAAKGFDASPTSGNTNNAVSSDGVYQALTPSIKTAYAQPGITATRNYVAILGHICFVSFAFTCSENITSAKLCFYLPNGFRSDTAFTSYFVAYDSNWVSHIGYMTAVDGAVYVRATPSASISAGTTIMMSGVMIIP